MLNFKKRAICLILVLSLTSAATVVASAGALMDVKGETEAKRPAQPASGPGGSAYAYKDVDVYHVGTGGNEYWIYEPVSKKGEKLHVVIFLHGWGAMFPQVYGGWIRHLSMSGNIVIYPRYQATFMSLPDEMYSNAISSVKTALDFCKKNCNATMDLEKVSAVGHSFGGVMAANFAADWKSKNLPEIKSFMSVQPGDGENLKKRKFIPVKTASIMSDYSQIPGTTKFVSIAGADDNLVSDIAAKKIFINANKVPANQKNFIVVQSDFHGNPPLLADHMQPLCTDDDLDADFKKFEGGEKGRLFKPGESHLSKRSPRLGQERDGFEPDAYDYYPLWRTFDALTSCAYDGKNCELALGESEKLKSSAKWSDGVPLKSLLISSPEK